MPEEPKISVVIPVYNGERYLVECIQSVYRQTYSNFEIIVVDDASTDGTRAIIERLRDSYGQLRYFRNEKNLGTGGSRNVGIRESKADLVGFLDQDDRWYPTFLETQLRILDANPDIDCLYCDFDFIDEASNVTDISSGCYVCQGEPSINRIGIEAIWKGQTPIPSTVIFRKSALFDVGLFSVEYLDCINMWIKFAVGHSFAETGLLLGSYRKHQAQKSTDDFRIVVARTKAYQGAVLAYPEIRHLVGPKLFAEVMHDHTAMAGNNWFWIKQDYTRAAEYFWQAYQYRPTDLETLIKLAWCWTPPMLRKLVRTVKTVLTSR